MTLQFDQVILVILILNKVTHIEKISSPDDRGILEHPHLELADSQNANRIIKSNHCVCVFVCSEGTQCKS